MWKCRAMKSNAGTGTWLLTCVNGTDGRRACAFSPFVGPWRSCLVFLRTGENRLATSWRLLTDCLSSSSSICVRDQTQRVELTIDKTSGAEMNHDPAGGLCDAMGTISMPRKWRLGNGRAITATFTVVCAALLFLLFFYIYAVFLLLCSFLTNKRVHLHRWIL